MWLKDDRTSHTRYAPSYPLTATFCTKSTTVHATEQTHHQRPANNRNNSNHGDTPDNTKLQRRTHSHAARLTPAQHGHTAARSGPTRPQLNRTTLRSNTTDRLPGHLDASSRPQQPHCSCCSPTNAATTQHDNNEAGTNHQPTAPLPQGPTRHQTAPTKNISWTANHPRHHSRKTTDSVSPQGGDVATQPCLTCINRESNKALQKQRVQNPRTLATTNHRPQHRNQSRSRRPPQDAKRETKAVWCVSREDEPKCSAE